MDYLRRDSVYPDMAFKDGSDRYEPIRRLAMALAPRKPTKPVTPFSITDILLRTSSTKPASTQRGIKRSNLGEPTLRLPNHHLLPPPAHQHHSPRHHLSPLQQQHHQSFLRPWDRPGSSPRSESTSEQSDDEEINVEDDTPPATLARGALANSSPLDALLQMTSKTFTGLEASSTMDDAARRDQLSLFAKAQPAKKRRKSRTAFTNQQIYELEKRFLYQKYLTPADRDEIAQTLGLSNAQVITWFQNRRAKLKRDLEELKNDVVHAHKVSSDGEEVAEEILSVAAKALSASGSLGSPGERTDRHSPREMMTRDVPLRLPSPPAHSPTTSTSPPSSPGNESHRSSPNITKPIPFPRSSSPTRVNQSIAPVMHFPVTTGSEAKRRSSSPERESPSPKSPKDASSETSDV